MKRLQQIIISTSRVKSLAHMDDLELVGFIRHCFRDRLEDCSAEADAVSEAVYRLERRATRAAS